MPEDNDQAAGKRRFLIYAGVAIGLILLLLAIFLFIRWATQFT